MPGNLRKKTTKNAGRTEREYLRMRRRVLSRSGICHLCKSPIDPNLKPICQFVRTDGYTWENAHETPLTCGPVCEGHSKKANPWSGSLDHVTPVSDLPPDSPLLTADSNGKPAHLDCNRRRGNRPPTSKARNKVSRDWLL